MEQKKTVAERLLNERRKWQIALRRYIFLQNKARHYAPYFGVDAIGFRSWIESQFGNNLSWENFSTHWQLEHVVPLGCFDWNKDEDLYLCWNFTNIRVGCLQNIESAIDSHKILAAKAYFEMLFQQSGYVICSKMLNKLNEIEAKYIDNVFPKATPFLHQYQQRLNTLTTFSTYEFLQLNDGMPFEDVLTEKQLLEKYAK